MGLYHIVPIKIPGSLPPPLPINKMKYEGRIDLPADSRFWEQLPKLTFHIVTHEVSKGGKSHFHYLFDTELTHNKESKINKYIREITGVEGRMSLHTQLVKDISKMVRYMCKDGNIRYVDQTGQQLIDDAFPIEKESPMEFDDEVEEEKPKKEKKPIWNMYRDGIKEYADAFVQYNSATDYSQSLGVFYRDFNAYFVKRRHTWHPTRVYHNMNIYVGMIRHYWMCHVATEGAAAELLNDECYRILRV